VQTYAVRVERIDEGHARAAVRDATLTLGARRADPSAGFNPVETLLSACGDCLLTAVQHIAGLSRAVIADARVDLEAQRQDKPPRLTEIRYTLHLSSDEPDDRLQHVVELAQANSTVLQTVALAVPVQGRWTRLEATPPNRPADGSDSASALP